MRVWCSPIQCPLIKRLCNEVFPLRLRSFVGHLSEEMKVSYNILMCRLTTRFVWFVLVFLSQIELKAFQVCSLYLSSTLNNQSDWK